MSTSKGSAAGSIRQAVVTTLVLLLICGFLFPVLMTGLGSLIFPSQAGGNLIYVDGQPVGSRFVGQEFIRSPVYEGTSLPVPLQYLLCG